MKIMRIFAVILSVVMCMAVCIVPLSATQDDKEITVLFTHDLHSHLLPSANKSGQGEYGGYARLMTAINAQKAIDPDAILVDAGDFSMGS